ncbi:SRPBCC family protein [Thalassotalea mangrovi]|uniref:Carbon monoxide dehydrogenase n=1 Tax=Thalassotalea mangrovi TaxID=2572245 RepID=A0A4U1B8J7_9GAMM|nr:SRPBCC family protein [Thalassotalea mangrovi]TKB46598.1 carbon monoxide dehydrogenase [Thalassotalea mangrovi]
MKVNMEKSFTLPGPAINAWTFLQQIEKVAACMPGAEITEAIDERNYKGKVKAKIGPATMAFNGDIVVEDIDPEAMSLRLIGKGQDSKGTSSAAMDLTARVIAVDESSCELQGNAEMTVTGKAASLGGRMLTQVADQILNQFGKNFENNVAAMGPDEAAAQQAKEELAQQPKELNGLALAWSVITGWFAGLFGGKKA